MRCAVSKFNSHSFIDGASSDRLFMAARTGGLFKPTSTGGWAHLTCALWVPESHIQDPVRMEPVVAKLSKQRMGLLCVLCGVRGGGCIQWYA